MNIQLPQPCEHVNFSYLAPAMRIHFIQHVAFEYPGSIVDWAANHNFSTSYTMVFEAVAFPPLPSFDVLVILGGPMGVYEENVLPWITAEKAFIQQAIAAGKKVFGICLGAQLVASVLGAAVYPHTEKEIGWWPVQKVTAHALTNLLPSEFTTFHWHGDTYDLPAGAECLFSSTACAQQGFVYGKNVVGLQFHMEVKEDLLNGMTEHERSELTGQGYVQSEATINSFIQAEVPKQSSYLQTVLDAFLLL